ncbi:MAG: hypothetical protein ACJ72N_08470 [Labedaea sp.]
MDTTVSQAICVVSLDDTAVEPWFELICATYQQLSESDKGDWQCFASALNEGAPSAGVDRPLVAQFVERMAANDLAPLETVGQMAMLSGELSAHYREHATTAAAAPEASAEAYDESGWQPFLMEHGVRWDGTEPSWEQFKVWFLYEAEQQGMMVPATGFVTYAESEHDKAAVFAQYQVPINCAAAETGDKETPIDIDAFPDTKIGDSGEWVNYLDTMLTHHGF